ncbi:MAG: BREX-3 system P-loop-containing protein BrxF [Bacillus sp. (in: Bacteria)]|nr:BREX-3 system P-loop-containing protein BrxF [Bacillus sp. (in: firmicutes)]
MSDRIIEEIQQLNTQRYPILILFSETDSMEDVVEQIRTIPMTYVNLNLDLSEKLKSLPSSKRGRKVPGIIRGILHEKREEIIFIERMEYLFDKELQLDPLRLLESLSGNKKIIIWWPGELDGNCLKYAGADHPEYYTNYDYGKNTLIL